MRSPVKVDSLRKGRRKYNRATGSKLKAPQPGGGPRKRSFCARMSGVKGPMKDSKGRPTRKALALRRWKCWVCLEDLLEDLVVRPNPLSFQQRTISAVSSAVAVENKEKADNLQTKVTALESDPFFVTIDGGGPVLDDTDIFDGGQADA